MGEEIKEYTPEQLLAREVEAVFRQFIYAPNDQSYTAFTLWTLHTHLRDRSGEFLPYITPRFYLGSKRAGCGKSLALRVMARLSHNGEKVTSPTPPSIMALMNVTHSTIGFDEIDTYFRRNGGGRDDMRGILNEGYEVGAHTTRIRDGAVERQNIHGPIALAGKNADEFLHHENWETLRTRSLSVILDRKPVDAYIDQYDSERHNPRLRGLMERLKDWGVANARGICKIDVEDIIPKQIANREREIWKILFRLGQHLGDEWPERVEKAARSFVLGEWDVDDTPFITPAAELLTCVQMVFKDDEDFLSTDDILFRIGQGSIRPSLMDEWATKRSAEMGLASALGVQVGAKPIRRQVDGEQAMGYTRTSVRCPEPALELDKLTS